MSVARTLTAAELAEQQPHVLLFAGRFAVRGTCAYTLRLAEQLPEEGFAVSVVCPDAQRVEATVRKELGIREYPMMQAPLWGRVVLEMLYREWRDDPPDLIHIQSRNAISQGSWLARRLRRPFVATVHDYMQPRQQLRIDRQWCRRIIAVSEAVKADLIGRTGLPDELVTVIQSGVGCEGACPERMVLDPQRVPVVGTAGPLEAVKGFPFFLGAAARVLSTGRDVEFVIAGAGPEEENLRRLARDLQIADHVTFVPNLADFSEALEAMDIFCLPSLQQGIGTIMLEAMALARPVIATRVGGVYRVVQDGETGLLVPPSDSAQLADRILELLNDPERARQIGTSAQRRVSGEYNEERMVDVTAALYRDVLAAAEPALVSPRAVAVRA